MDYAEIENIVLNRTNKELISMYTKNELLRLFQDYIGCSPRTGMTKLDVVTELRLSIKYRMRNRILLSDC